MIPWHRLFGLTLTDFFAGSSYSVELEKDLSVKYQLLDVVIVEKNEGTPPAELPDGLENLAAHNLLTYKSLQESLDGWTVEELMGHYVNYRKQISPKGKLLAPENFRVYAVSTKYPKKLSTQVDFTEISPGVYEVKWGIRNVRIIVLSLIPKTERNAVWLMFSAVPEKVGFGAGNYEWNIPVSTVINQLFSKYKEGGIEMAYTVEDYHRDLKKEAMKIMTEEDLASLMNNFGPEKVLKRLKPEDVLKIYRPEDVMKTYRPEERLKGLKAEERLKGLKTEEVLKGMKPEQIEAYLKKLNRKTKRK